MKKLFVLGFMLLYSLSASVAQSRSLLLIVDKQERKLNVLLNKPPSVFDDYQEITSLCKKLGENYKRLGYEATTERGKGANHRKSVKYYSDEARYANIAADKFGNRYMLQVSVKACKNAAFVYRALGRPKVITLLDDKFIDTCGLLPGDEETDVEKPKEEDNKPVSSNSAARITFATKDDVFSILVPHPLVAETIFGAKATVFSANELLKIMEESSALGFSGSGMNAYEIKGYQISIGFSAQTRNKTTEQIYGSVGRFNKKRNNRTFSIGDEDYNLGPYEARLTYDWEWEIDNPIHSKDDLMATINIKFKTKGYFCDFSVVVRNLDQINIEKKVMQMVRSFRVESASEPISTCKDGDYKLLKKGIPVTWIIYDRSRPSTIVQQPVIARDYEIAAAAANYTGAILEVIKKGKDVRQLTRIPREVMIEGDIKKAIAELGGWYFEGYTKVDFIPVEIEEYSDLTIDGSLTNAVIFYLEALRDINKGVSGLGKRINKMSQRLYWEIPTIKIKGECIPRMFCDNGVWKPDRDYLEFREISRTKGTYRSPNKDFMTVKEVADDLQRYYYDILDKLEADEMKYRKVVERCNESRKSLWKIDFPLNFDKCPGIENNIQLKQNELLLLMHIRSIKKDEMSHWLNTLKPAEIQRLNERLLFLTQEIDAKRNKIPGLERLRDNYMNSGQPEKAAEISDQLRFLREDIDLLISFQLKTKGVLKIITSGKKESELSEELSKISEQISNLNKAKEKLKKKLAECLTEAAKVR